MHQRRTIFLGGASFILGALAFIAVFSYLAAQFDYPAILDGAAREVLPRLLAGGSALRTVWAVYAFLPLLLIPAAVGAFVALPVARGRMTLALILASLGAFAMCLGLMRWPSVHWELAQAWPAASAEAQHGMAAVFAGLNVYLGNYVGEFFGEAALAAFFALTAAAMLDERRVPRWLGWAGLVFALLFFAGAFRNVTGAVQLISDIDNYLLPLWMITLGVTLIRFSRQPENREP